MREKLNKKTIRWILFGIVALLVASALLMIGCRLRVRSAEYPLFWQGQLAKIEGRYACIIVPGAAVSGGAPESHLRDRLDTAAALYRAGASDTILLSGGYNEEQGVWESRVMMAYLDQKGIPREAMILDDFGFDTAETLRRAKAMVEAEPVIICTQSLYADRTAFLAEKFHLESAIADSDIRIYTVGVGKARLREFFAAAKAAFEGKACRYSLEECPMKGGAEDA